MNKKSFLTFLSVGISVCAFSAESPKFTESFLVDKGDLSSIGKSDYFVLEPGFVAVYEGNEGGQATLLSITVTAETKLVDGVATRVVEEKETVNGKIKEISRNYFAIAKKTGDVYYFGEDSDSYKDGKVVNSDGSWLSGVAGAKFGLAMPGKPELGAAYYQELAPNIAMDRAEVVSVTETIKTPAGEFQNCVKIKETTPIEKGVEYKLYAPHVGLLRDGDLNLIKYGKETK